MGNLQMVSAMRKFVQSTTISWFQLQHASVIKLAFVFAMMVSVQVGWGQTYYNMSSGNKTWDFADMANWTNNFASGTDAANWRSVGIIGSGTSVTTGTRTTKSSATFVSGTSGGLQKGTQAMVFLSTGSTSTPEAVAVDLLLDFSGRTAGTLSFDWTGLDNSSGTRPTSLRVFWTTDGITFTEITGAQVLDQVSSSSGSITAVALPAEFNNSSTAVLRFYNHAGSNSIGGGSRDKMQIDNVAVTSTATSCSAPTNQATSVVANYTCANSITLGWANGNGTKRIVKINSSNSFTAPTDGDDPSANTVYSGSGEQVVYNDNSNSVNITGLNSNTTYWFRIYEYNCTGLNTKYLDAISSTSLVTNSSICNTVGDYQSRAGGDWNNSATWQKWDGGNWANCTGTDFPDNGTANVTIRSGHNIDNDGGGAGTQPNPTGAPWDVRNLTVEAGAVLKDYSFVGGNSYIQIYGNIVCNGTIGDPLGDDISFDIAGGANCTITGSGSFTASRIRKDDFINAASDASLTFDMDIRLTWSQSSGVVLVNDASATSNFDVNVNSGKTVRCFGPGSIACNVSIDGLSGDDIIDLGGTYTIFGTMDIDGALVSLNNNSLRRTSVIVKNNGILKCRYIQTGGSGAAGNILRVESGGRLNIFGSVDTVGSADQTTWNNFSTTNNTWDFQPGSTLEYSGNTLQSVNGITQCSNFTVSGGGAKTLSNPFTVGGILTLTNGRLNTTSTNILTLTSTATCPAGGSFSSFVNGPMRKEGTDDFRFPVGKPAVNRLNISGTGNVMNGGYRPISISGLSLASGNTNFLAEYHLTNPYLQGSISPAATAAGLQAISRCEYWDLVRESGTQTPVVTLTWSDNSIQGQSQCNVGPYIINPTSTFVVPYYNGMWGDQNSTYYGRSGSITTPSSPLFLGEISWDGAAVIIDSYLKFVIGTNNWQQAPLPFDIKNFKATGKGKIVQLDWLINHNDEVRSYVIERSRDGIHFENMKMVAARANEDLAAYADVDPAPFNGWGYYRLRITDFAGKIGYSAIQKVWMGNSGTYVQVTPKPAKDRLWINLAEPEKISEMVIVNSVGQLLFKQNRVTNNNQIDISSFRPGIYYVRIVGQNGIVTEPFVKE